MEKYRQPKQQFLTGAELLERNEVGRERYKLKAGAYQFEFGFRNFGEHKIDWLSRASDSASDWETPFMFDYEHPKVAEFTKNLFQGESNFENPEAVRALADRLGQLIRSMGINEPEYNNSLSDIVTSGKGMCDAKSVLFGSLLARHTNLKAQAIIGQYGKVHERVSYPFHHQWMRISDGTHVYLFDPMYKRFSAFENEGDAFYPLDEEDSHFSNLTPACYPAAKLMTQMGISRFGGVQVVESNSGDSHEIYVNNEESLPVQLSNSATFAFEIDKEKEFEIYDGAIKTGSDETALYFPIKGFRELK